MISRYLPFVVVRGLRICRFIIYISLKDGALCLLISMLNNEPCTAFENTERNAESCIALGFVSGSHCIWLDW